MTPTSTVTAHVQEEEDLVATSEVGLSSGGAVAIIMMTLSKV